MSRLRAALRLLKGKLGTKKRHDLGERLIEIFKERVTPSEWQRIIAEAQWRADAQKPLAPVTASLADIGPGETGKPGCE